MRLRTASLAGVVLLAFVSFGVDRAADAPPPPPPPPATASVAELLKARIDTAAEGMRLSEQRYRAALTTMVEPISWKKRWTDARLDAAETKEQRLAVMREGVAVMRENEAVVDQMFQAGMPNATQTDVAFARFERLGAELRLARTLAE